MNDIQGPGFNLTDLGWSEFFQKQAEPLLGGGRDVGRVAEQHRTEYILFTRYGELRASIAGKIRLTATSSGDYPAVGDWVVIEPRPEESSARITAILPRRTRFSRGAPGTETAEQILAANVETAFWITTVTAEFNPRRVERYLAAVWESGARPAIILNKADLCGPEEIEKKVWELAAIAPPGVPVHVLSARMREGFGQIEPYFERGCTVVFLGMSGVGKSSIINVLNGADIQKIQEIRERDSRGRHTTATRELILLPGGGMVIDTPGIRELQIWDTGGALESFSDIEALSPECRFADCAHESEPGCAVRAAVEDGRIERTHYENYLKLKRELSRMESRKNIRSRIDEKRRLKIFGRLRKDMKKHTPGK